VSIGVLSVVKVRRRKKWRGKGRKTERLLEGVVDEIRKTAVQHPSPSIGDYLHYGRRVLS